MRITKFFMTVTMAACITGLTFIHCSDNLPAKPLSNLADRAVFHIYLNKVKRAEITSSIDKKGNYNRHFVAVSSSGKKLEFKMKITPNRKGDWQKVEIINPNFGNWEVTREGNKAKYKQDGEWKSFDIPEDYTFFDDNGNLFESVMLRKYDMKMKGKQLFTRFRVPEAPLPAGNVFEVELEYLWQESIKIRDKKQDFLVFNYKVFGIDVKYWVDEERKLCMVHSPKERVIAVREGCEDLIPVAEKSAAEIQ